MALIALGLQARGELRGGAVVATVMSNLGLERKLGEPGLKLLRTQVGDRYVLEEMRKSGCNVGGEQSRAHHPRRSCDDRRRPRRRAAGARRAGRGERPGERAAAPVRADAAAPQERPLQRWRRAARGRQRPQAHRRRGGRTRGPGPPGDPQVGHRAADPRHGGGRRSGSSSSGWSTTFARPCNPRREPFLGNCRPNDDAVHMDNFAPGAGRRRER